MKMYLVKEDKLRKLLTAQGVIPDGIIKELDDDESVMELMDPVSDVYAFNDKYGLPHPVVPHLPLGDLHQYRFKFLNEELRELEDAWMTNDIVGYLDALVDLVYVAIGTALLSGLPFRQAWSAVHDANMRKERVPSADASKRAHAFDVRKPSGWVGPEKKIREVIEAWSRVAV